MWPPGPSELYPNRLALKLVWAPLHHFFFFINRGPTRALVSPLPESSHPPNPFVAVSCRSPLLFVYIDHGAISCGFRALGPPGRYSNHCI